MKQGGTAGIPSLTKVYFVKDFFVIHDEPSTDSCLHENLYLANV